MTKLLEQAIEAVRKLPPDRQNELAEALEAAVETIPRAYKVSSLRA